MFGLDHPAARSKCRRCGHEDYADHFEVCWKCGGRLCAFCWDIYGECGHPEEAASRIPAALQACLDDGTTR